jgi:hypothetical protein
VGVQPRRTRVGVGREEKTGRGASRRARAAEMKTGCGRWGAGRATGLTGGRRGEAMWAPPAAVVAWL